MAHLPLPASLETDFASPARGCDHTCGPESVPSRLRLARNSEFTRSMLHFLDRTILTLSLGISELPSENYIQGAPYPSAGLDPKRMG